MYIVLSVEDTVCFEGVKFGCTAKTKESLHVPIMSSNLLRLSLNFFSLSKSLIHW